MSFTVTLYNHVKPVNSTALPAQNNTGSPYNCVTNTALDIIDPVLDFVLPIGATIYNYNYAYVPNLSRYYWIEKWEYNDRKWRAFCHVDVLGSHRTAIGNLSPYVLRSAHTWNGDIQDNFYPAKCSWTKTVLTQSNPWALSGTGCFALGIISSQGNTKYYLFRNDRVAPFFATMFDRVFAEACLSNLGISAYPEAKAILDPLQYIASIVYLPFAYPQADEVVGGLSVGYATIDPVAYVPIDRTIPYTNTFTFNRPTHPQNSGNDPRGGFLNAAPYTRLSMYFPPFGVIDIDTSSAMTGSTITATVYVDKALGNATLEISIGTQTLSRVNAKVGLPVQMSQIIAPGYGIISAAGSVAGAVTNALTGNWGGLASGIASGIGDAIKSQIPSANTIGSVGSIDSMLGNIKLQAVFAQIVDDDIVSRGRPLCEVRTINTIPGFIQCADVEVNLGCTSGEMTEIKSFMESGFFYA